MERLARVIVAATIIAACSPAPETHAPPTPHAIAPATAAAIAPPRVPVEDVQRDDVVLVTDPAVLKEVEAHGGSLHALLDGAASAGPRYAAMVASVRADVAAAKAADPASGVGLGASHRLFDVRMLGSSEAKFELVAISNRIDRKHVAPDACGEVRFIYRLAYATTKSGIAIASRLPVTLALSFWSRGRRARATAAQWRSDGRSRADDRRRHGSSPKKGPSALSMPSARGSNHWS